jgi:arylsulfatase A-like enzyme
VPRVRVPALLLLALAVGPGCGGRPPARPDGAVVVVVDALRADHLGCYGYQRPTSPSIDALAAGGTRFVQAISPAPWTLPAMATLWTGLLPAVHGAMQASDMHAWMADRSTFRPTSVLDASRTTLAEVLRDHGFATAAFVGGSYPSAVFGMAQGFETFVDEGLFGPRMQVEALWRWLDTERPTRFFAYLHMMSVHSPYQPPVADLHAMPHDGTRAAEVRALLAEEQRRWAAVDFDPEYAGTIDGSWTTLEKIRRSGHLPPERDVTHLAALYDRGIRYTDHWIGEVAAGLEARGLSGSTMVVVTADHGEELGDHGRLEHTRTFYEEMMRVPLVVVAPGLGAGRVVQAQVGLVDLFPTLLDLLAVPYDGPVQGISLLPALEGKPLPEREMVGEASQVSGLRALRSPTHKYVAGSQGEELYDLRDDPAERRNLCLPDPGACAPFRERLRAREEESAALLARSGLPPPPDAAIDAEMRQRLRALGYAN